MNSLVYGQEIVTALGSHFSHLNVFHTHILYLSTWLAEDCHPLDEEVMHLVSLPELSLAKNDRLLPDQYHLAITKKHPTRLKGPVEVTLSQAKDD